MATSTRALVGILVFVFTALLAVVFGCTWMLWVLAVVAELVGLVRLSWWLANRFTGANVGMWWQQHRSVIGRTALIFAIILGVVAIIACSVHRWAPSCTGGCWSGSTSVTTTTMSRVSASGATHEPAMVAVSSDGWSSATVINPGRQVLWEPVANVSFIIRTQSGKEHIYPRDPEGDRRTACERMIWIPEAVSSFQVRLADGEQPTGLKLGWSPYSPEGPCQKVVPGAAPPTAAPAVPPYEMVHL